LRSFSGIASPVAQCAGEWARVRDACSRRVAQFEVMCWIIGVELMELTCSVVGQ
jgi:hypothetical protein